MKKNQTNHPILISMKVNNIFPPLLPAVSFMEMSKPRGFLGHAQLMGEVKLASPGPEGNKTSAASAQQGEREEIFNFTECPAVGTGLR